MSSAQLLVEMRHDVVVAAERLEPSPQRLRPRWLAAAAALVLVASLAGAIITTDDSASADLEVLRQGDELLITLHDDKPVIKVIDFGIAKAMNQDLTEATVFTEFRQFIGTPEYMSPEQFDGTDRIRVAERHDQVAAGLESVGSGGNDGPQFGNRLLDAAKLQQQIAEVVAVGRNIVSQRCGPPVAGDGILRPALPALRGAEIGERVGTAGVELDRPARAGLGSDEIPLQHQHGRKVAVKLGPARLEGTGPLEIPHRFGAPPLLLDGDAQQVEHLGIVGVGDEDTPQRPLALHPGGALQQLHGICEQGQIALRSSSTGCVRRGTSPKPTTPPAFAGGVCRRSFVSRPHVLGRPGSDLLSQALRLSTIGAKEFNGRVRDGIGFWAPRNYHQIGEKHAGEFWLCFLILGTDRSSLPQSLAGMD